MIVKGSLRDRVDRAFHEKFIHYHAVSRVLCNGYQGDPYGKNVILYGAGGYGKSQMALRFARTVLSGNESAIYVQSVGSSTREDEMWGGLKLSSLRDGESIEYQLANSFLNYEIVIFEELFDLPVRILNDMKDTLSARIFRRGPTQFPMRTRMIIACTNSSPTEIAARGVSEEAMTQRFPIRCNVFWSDHRPNDYIAMFKKQKPELQSLAPLLAQICSDIAGKGVKPVPPRLAIDALEAVYNEATSCGRDVVVPSDLSILLNIAPFESVQEHAAEILKSALNRFGGTLELNRIDVEASHIISELETLPAKDLTGYAELTAKLNLLQTQLKSVVIPGDAGEGYQLRQKVASNITAALRIKKNGGA